MAENRKILEGGKKILLTKGALLKDAIVSSRNVFIEILFGLKMKGFCMIN